MNNVWVECEIVQIDMSIKCKPFVIKTLFKSYLLFASSNGNYMDTVVFGLNSLKMEITLFYFHF